MHWRTSGCRLNVPPRPKLRHWHAPLIALVNIRFLMLDRRRNLRGFNPEFKSFIIIGGWMVWMKAGVIRRLATTAPAFALVCSALAGGPLDWDFESLWALDLNCNLY